MARRRNLTACHPHRTLSVSSTPARWLSILASLCIGVTLAEAQTADPKISTRSGDHGNVDTRESTENPVEFSLAVARVSRDESVIVQTGVALIRAGQFEQTMDLAKELAERDHPFQQMGLTVIAIELAQADQYAMAIEATDLIEDDFGKLRALSQLSSTLHQRGKKSEALNVLTRSLDIVVNLEQQPGSEKATLLEEISTGIREQGDLPKAHKVFEKAVQEAMQLEHPEEKSALLSRFAIKLATDPVDAQTSYPQWGLLSPILFRGNPIRRMKTEFRPEEQQLAKKIRDELISEEETQVAIEGRWVDSLGCEIEISQDGSRFTAVVRNNKVQNWWTEASGNLRGKSITLTQKNSNTISTTVGFFLNDDRIRWNDGSHWEKAKLQNGQPQQRPSSPSDERKSSATDSIEKDPYAGLSEWLKSIEKSEASLDDWIAKEQNPSTEEAELQPMLIWETGSRSNKMSGKPSRAALQEIANQQGYLLRFRDIKFREFNAALEQALQRDELPDALFINNYQTLYAAEELTDGALVLAENSLSPGPAPAVLFTSSKNHQAVMALAVRKPKPPVELADAQGRISKEDAEALERLCLASFKAFVSGDHDSMNQLSDPLTAGGNSRTLTIPRSPNVVGVGVSGMTGNARLAYVQVDSRISGEDEIRGKRKNRFVGTLTRGFLCRKTNGSWKILNSSRGLNELKDVARQLSIETDLAKPPMTPPQIRFPEDGARLTRSPRPNISWTTCGDPQAVYFVESQYAPSRASNAWSESWMKRVNRDSQGESITIPAPFGVGAQPHRWRVWAISNNGEVSLSDWRTIYYSR